MGRPVREIAAVAVACAVGAAAGGGLLSGARAETAKAAVVPVWTAPVPADTSGHPGAVSCPSESLCVAVDDGGEVWTTSDPGAAAPGWTGAPVDPGQAITGVACPSNGLCVAVDGAGNALYSTDPGGGAGAWTPVPIDAGRALAAVSCASTALCVAVDGAGNVVASVDAAQGNWTRAPMNVDGANGLAAVSCGSPSLCVAVDGAGGAVASSEPAVAAAWHRRAIDTVPGLTAISCIGAGACVAVDGSGNALASPDPTAAAPTWSATAADQMGAPSGVSCAGWGACVAVDGGGNALTSEDPLAGLPSWGAQGVDPTALTAVSCVAGGLCVAVDAAGRSLSTRLQMPAPTLEPVAVVHPRPAIAGTPAVGSLLECLPGVSVGTAQLSFEWLRDTLAVPGASGASYRVKGTDAGHHLQCRVTATNSGGRASGTSAFVTVPFEGLPLASGETAVGRALVRGARVVVPVACSTKAPHGCRLLLRLMRAGGGGRALLLGTRRARMGRGQRKFVSVSLKAAGRRLLARAKRMAVRLTVTGTVIGDIEALLAEQRLTLGAQASRRASRGRGARARGG